MFTLVLSPVETFVRSPPETLVRSPPETLVRSPVDTLFPLEAFDLSAADTLPPEALLAVRSPEAAALSFDAGVCEGVAGLAAAVFREADDWLPPLIDLLDVAGCCDGVGRLCVVEGRLCVVAGRLCAEEEEGRLMLLPPEGRLPPPPPPPIRWASNDSGSRNAVKTISNPVLKNIDLKFAFI